MKKKRSTIEREKRKPKVKPRPPRVRPVPLEEPAPKPAVEPMPEEDGFPEVELIGDEVGDPDAGLLASQEGELTDDLDLKNPDVAAELAEDPVRLYLREIGQVRLLDSDSEFRLATINEANRLIVALRRRPLRKAPLAR